MGTYSERNDKASGEQESIYPNDLDLYVLAGQSNMEGYGWQKKREPSDESVWLFSSAGQWEIAADPLHRLLESYTPTHLLLMSQERSELKDSVELRRIALEARTLKGPGVGPGLTFGKAMVAATGRSVGLIPAAHGGSSLVQWAPAFHDPEGETLYGAMLNRIRRTVDVDRAGTLKGILWYQGETDALNETDFETYASRFDAWIDDVRRDTGLPNLPIVAVQLGTCFNLEVSDAQSQGWEHVRKAQAMLPWRRPHTAVTSALDLPLDDTIHIAECGQRRLGRRLARRMLLLQGGTYASPESVSGPQILRIEHQPPRFNGIGVLRVVIHNVHGSLTPATHMSGFDVWENTEGHVPFPLRLIAADLESAVVASPPVLPSGQCAVRLLLNRDPALSVRVSYGKGMTCYGNVTDQADDPLLAFELPVDSIYAKRPSDR